MWRVFLLVCAAVVFLTGCPLDSTPTRTDTARGVRPADLLTPPGDTVEAGNIPTN